MFNFVLSFPILTIVAVLLVAFFYALVISSDRTALIRQICLVASFIALFVGILAALSFDKAAVGYQYMSNFNLTAEYNSAFALGVDGLSYVFLILTLFTFPFLFLAAWNVSKFPKHFFCHLLAMEILLVLTFVTIDLFYFFVLFESLLIPMFLLIGSWGARTRKIKAAYYFFLYTLFGSLFMLFGMIYLYQTAGSLNYYVLLSEIIEDKEQRLLWVCLFLAFAVKMPLFPFHIWLPEAHVEAPTVGSMLLASLLLKLGGYGILRFLLTFLTDASVFFTPLVVTLGIGGVVYGSLSTLRQIDLKRVIAYSSVAHMNLVVVGLFSFTRFGIEGAIYMMVAHGVVSSALFFLVGVIYDRTHTRLLRYYGGLVTVMPLFVSFFFVFSLANMGFPGTPNFPGELLILMGAFAIAPHVAFESGLGVVFSSAYSTFTHARISFGTLKTKYIHQFIDMLPREVSVVFVLLIVATVLGIQTAPVLTFVEVSSWDIAYFHQDSSLACLFFSVARPRTLTYNTMTLPQLQRRYLTITSKTTATSQPVLFQKTICQKSDVALAQRAKDEKELQGFVIMFALLPLALFIPFAIFGGNYTVTIAGVFTAPLSVYFSITPMATLVLSHYLFKSTCRARIKRFFWVVTTLFISTYTVPCIGVIRGMQNFSFVIEGNVNDIVLKTSGVVVNKKLSTEEKAAAIEEALEQRVAELPEKAVQLRALAKDLHSTWNAAGADAVNRFLNIEQIRLGKEAIHAWKAILDKTVAMQNSYQPASRANWNTFAGVYNWFWEHQAGVLYLAVFVALLYTGYDLWAESLTVPEEVRAEVLASLVGALKTAGLLQSGILGYRLTRDYITSSDGWSTWKSVAERRAGIIARIDEIEKLVERLSQGGMF